jgi:hypothetical protein
MTINKMALSKKIKKSNKLYDIFLDEIDAGPLDGGCYAMAKSLQNVLGGKLFTITGENTKNGKIIGQHIVLKTDDEYWDGNGKTVTESKLLKDFEKNEIIFSPALRPFKKEDCPNSPRSKMLIKKVTAYLKGA